MASLGIHCLPNQNLRLSTNRSNLNLHPTLNQISKSRCSLSISKPITKQTPPKIGSCNSNRTVMEEHKHSDKIDEWMRDSVSEIVKNLREAPLFVQVYENNNDKGSTKVKTEKAIAEEWPIITKKWKNNEISSPDGIILVEELEEEERDSNGDCEEEEEKGERAWGLVVQEKGLECVPACYLLKTSRVGSGLGCYCTHFCLARVQNFRQSALSQLTDCWLLE